MQSLPQKITLAHSSTGCPITMRKDNEMSLQGLHHIAYKCKDPEETRTFYEDLLDLPMVLTVELSRTPTTGEPDAHYFHFFFEMADGSCIAFFDLGDNEMPQRGANIPSWVNHLAMRVADIAELRAYRAKLEAAGLQVDGEIDHEFCRSIYFFDPNGVRLEITCDTLPDGFAEKSRAEARRGFDRWVERRGSMERISA